MNHLAEEQYAENIYARDEQLEQVKQSIRHNGMPEISVSPGYGRLLTIMVKMAQAKSILEIGALGGYSGICLARGLKEEGRLVSLELKAEFALLAEQNLQAAGFGDKVKYRIGDALHSMEQLANEGETFDFVFIDADKVHAPEYLEWSIRLSTPGAIIIGDNTFMHGKTLDPSYTGPGVQGIRRFNERVAADPRLESTLIPAYDGLVIARVK
ncbi:MAG: O-methyltransferase [Gorillibacterium sp.]|nr:O-methyltransferase [Gorillibacterium sp.]